MNLRGRLLLFVIVVGVLTTTANQVTRELQPPPPSRKAIGLDWLQHEYHIPADAFARIVKMHHEYFARCDAMCAELIEARQPPPPHPRRRSAPPSGAAATLTRTTSESTQDAQRREKVICERCLDSMIAHLHAVAGEMDPEQGRRFLAELLPQLSHPADLQDPHQPMRTVR